MSSAMKKSIQPVLSSRISTSIDEELSLRCWAGQRSHVAAREMGISLRSYQARRRRLEIPKLPQSMQVDTFEIARAEQNIKTMRYRRQQCLAYKLHGIAFFFWRPINNVRRISRHSRSASRLSACWLQTDAKPEPSDTEA